MQKPLIYLLLLFLFFSCQSPSKKKKQVDVNPPENSETTADSELPANDKNEENPPKEIDQIPEEANKQVENPQPEIKSPGGGSGASSSEPEVPVASSSPVFDNYGFNVDGVHRDTGTLYDPDGYNRDGQNTLGEFRSTIELLRQDPAVSVNERTEFLEQTFERQSNDVINLFGLGGERTVIGGSNPSAPVFHSYHILGANSYFWAKFPPAFFDKIPAEILAEVRKYDIESLDLYFVPQGANFGVGDELEYKGVYWLHPDAPNPIPVGTYASGDILVGLFYPLFANADSALTSADLEFTHESNHIRFGSMVSKSYSMHDGRVSPNHGKINHPSSGNPFSFWSLSISQSDKKAAITLHWILPFLQSREIGQIVNSSNDTFNTLIPTLRSNTKFEFADLITSLEVLF